MRIATLARRIRNGILKLRLRAKPMERAFAYIYANNSWGSRESISGHGSTLENTETVRRVLPSLIEHHAVRSILDIPCGDFHWMQAIDLEGIDYTGADVVLELVRSNVKRYQRENRRFVHLDAATGDLPKVDLIVCRDLLVHLPILECEKVIANFLRSGSRLLLATSYSNQSVNREVELGAWRPLNLRRSPFGFPEPIQVLPDGPDDPKLQDYGKELCLWRLDQLRD